MYSKDYSYKPSTGMQVILQELSPTVYLQGCLYNVLKWEYVTVCGCGLPCLYNSSGLYMYSYNLVLM